jgi:hypothetical protein
MAGCGGEEARPAADVALSYTGDCSPPGAPGTCAWECLAKRVEVVASGERWQMACQMRP